MPFRRWLRETVGLFRGGSRSVITKADGRKGRSNCPLCQPGTGDDDGDSVWAVDRTGSQLTSEGDDVDGALYVVPMTPASAVSAKSSPLLPTRPGLELARIERSRSHATAREASTATTCTSNKALARGRDKLRSAVKRRLSSRTVPRPADGPHSLQRRQQHHQQRHSYYYSNASTRRPKAEAPLQAMSPQTIREVASLLTLLFPRFPLAICDEAAMTLHGHSSLQPTTTIDVVCPSPKAETLVCNAEAKGLRRSGLYPHAFYVATRDGALRCVRVLSSRRFACLARVDIGGLAVLSKECVADRLATYYLGCLERGELEAAERRGADLLWLLASMVEDGGADEFLHSLARRHPGALVLMRVAGFQIRPRARPLSKLAVRRCPWRATVCVDGRVINQASTNSASRGALYPLEAVVPSRALALLQRTMKLVQAATRLRLLGERARAASGAWPAPLRPRCRPGSCVTAPEMPRRSLARSHPAERRPLSRAERASRRSMELVIGKDIVLCQGPDGPGRHHHQPTRSK